MKVTNLKTKETYELSKDAAVKLAKSKLGKLYTFEKAAPTPPEVNTAPQAQQIVPQS